MLETLAVLLIAFAWVGHAYILTTVLNNLYARTLPKTFLKPLRHVIGVLILAFPLLILSGVNPDWFDFVDGSSVFVNGIWGCGVLAYAAACPFFGLLYFVVNLARYLRKPPA